MTSKRGQSKILRRPIQHICPLEEYSNPESKTGDDFKEAEASDCQKEAV